MVFFKIWVQQVLLIVILQFCRIHTNFIIKSTKTQIIATNYTESQYYHYLIRFFLFKKKSSCSSELQENQKFQSKRFIVVVDRMGRKCIAKPRHNEKKAYPFINCVVPINSTLIIRLKTNFIPLGSHSAMDVIPIYQNM